MQSYGGIVDSYANYVPIEETKPPPPVPSFNSIPTDDTEWCGVDEKVYDGPSGSDTVWSPSVCTSDSGIMAASQNDAVNILLDRHAFEWPNTIDGWRLVSVTREVVMDEPDTE